MEEKINEVCNRYGYKLLVILLDHYQYKEKFELCQLIENKILQMEGLLNVEIERSLKPSFIEDYVSDYWRYGLSGEVALNNLPYYVKESLDIIES